MKKFFTLIAAVLFAMGASADEVTLWEGEALVNGWGNQPQMLSDSGTELKNAGAVAGDKVRFYVDSFDEGWQVQVVEGHWGPTYEVYAGTALTNADTGEPIGNTVVDLATTPYLELELTQEILDAAYTQKWWGGVFILNGDGNVKVTKVTLKTALDWETTPKAVAFDDNGFIAASEFDGLDDKAKVQFTYLVTGELGSKVNWGIGRIGSNDDTGDGPSVVVGTLSATASDVNLVYGCFYEDIKKALEKTPDGILFSIWDFDGGAIQGSRVKVEAFNVVSTGINSARVEAENANAPIYNLAGQRVSASYKGVVIQNGKKFIQK